MSSRLNCSSLADQALKKYWDFWYIHPNHFGTKLKVFVMNSIYLRQSEIKLIDSRALVLVHQPKDKRESWLFI